MNPTAMPEPAAAPTCVLLLSLWAPPAGPWHARLVGTDAHVHDFGSPFELARFVAQGPSERSALPATRVDARHPGGLR
jgi:hypothetical protein